MDSKSALHTAARRFCQEPGWDYSPEASQIFPRYRVDAAIQAQVERLTPDSIKDVEELRGLLIRACDVAEDPLRAEFTNDLALIAIREEASDFRDYIQVLGTSGLTGLAPLPYRRVLSEEESEYLWNQLKQTWAVGDGYWFPLREGPLPRNVITFHVDYLSRMSGAQVLRESLRDRGILQVFQLNELKSTDPEYEMEVSILDPRYAGGGEQYTTSPPFDWVAYASHESSITIAGDWLTAIFKGRWPDWSQRGYRGPYSTDDMTGTWDAK